MSGAEWSRTRRYLVNDWAPSVPEDTALHLRHGCPAEKQRCGGASSVQTPHFLERSQLETLELDVGAAGSAVARSPR